MAVQKDARAPYASTGSIKTVIDKHRQVGLQSMSLQRLQQIGVTEALAPRTMQALVFLGFYDENGNVTPEFDALRKVPKHDFKPRLAALLREAYAPILEVLDPASATPLDVENAFRGFLPTGQIPRMVQLFIGLMAYVGLMPEPSRRSGGGTGVGHAANKPSGGRRSSGTSAVKPEPEPEPQHGQPPAHPPANGSVDAMKQAYFNLLIEKAKDAGTDDDLLDRIERLIGIPAPQGMPIREGIGDRTTVGSTPATPADPQ
jgi:Family of unknown function (DUF5343)